ncbi:Protein F46H5.7 b, partial [Aphelenchoides avenae]
VTTFRKLQERLSQKEQELSSLNETLMRLQEEVKQQGQQLEEERRSSAEKDSRLNQLNHENSRKQDTIDELYQRRSDELEEANNRSDREHALQHRVEQLESELEKLERRLKDAVQEKEFYKKEYAKNDRRSFAEVVNGGGGGGEREDFGKELMLANKRKYQLEEKVKRLEYELQRAHDNEKGTDERIKDLEKQLWHKGEHIARIEGDLRNVYSEKDQLRRENERLNSVVSAEKGGQGVDVAERIAKEVDEAKTQYEAKMKELQEQKGKMDWRVGEVTNLWNDAKWRVGELEAELGHKHWELQQAWDRIKEFESQNTEQTPISELHAEVDRLKKDVYRLEDEKNKSDWHLGEYKQSCNDAKWRCGELEAELERKTSELEQAKNRITELERGQTGDTGELQRVIDQLREEKSKSDWHLGEYKQLH